MGARNRTAMDRRGLDVLDHGMVRILLMASLSDDRRGKRSVGCSAKSRCHRYRANSGDRCTDGAAVRVVPVDASRSSATVQSAAAEKVPEPLSPAELAACRDARAQDRPAPKGVDCVQAAPAAALPAAPTAEVSLLGMLGERFDTGANPVNNTAPASANDVARQLSSGAFQGTINSDAAASVARDNAAPPPTSPR